MLQFGGYRLDLAGHSLLDATGKEVTLTHGEFGLLRVFVQRAGRVLSRDQLLQLLSGRDAEAFDRSIDMQVVRLRRKIEPDPKRPSLIVTIPSSGYKFTAKVRQAERRVAGRRNRSWPARDHAPPTANDASSPLSQPKCSRQKEAACRTIRRNLRALINAYRRYAAAVVARHGGVLAESRMREVLAYFGYPVAQEHAAERALHAALALAEHLPVGDLALPAGLAIRIGVASGLVVADPDGEVLGESPREAARLQNLAEPGQVIIAAEHAAARRRSVRLSRPRPARCQGRRRSGAGVAGARPQRARQPLRGAARRGADAAGRPRGGVAHAAAGLAAGEVR